MPDKVDIVSIDQSLAAEGITNATVNVTVASVP